MKPLLPCQIDAWNRAEALVAGFATVVLQMDCGALVVIDAAGFGWVMTMVSARAGDPDQRAILSPLEGPLPASVLAVRYACPALISYATAAARGQQGRARPRGAP